MDLNAKDKYEEETFTSACHKYLQIMLDLEHKQQVLKRRGCPSLVSASCVIVVWVISLACECWYIDGEFVHIGW